MKYCCKAFKNLVIEKWVSGVNLFVRDHFGEPAFFFQIRAKENSELIQSETTDSDQDTPSYLVVASQFRVIYCPWCGENLSKSYSSSWKELETITKKFDISLEEET